MYKLGSGVYLPDELFIFVKVRQFIEMVSGADTYELKEDKLDHDMSMDLHTDNSVDNFSNGNNVRWVVGHVNNIGTFLTNTCLLSNIKTLQCVDRSLLP